LDVTAIDVNGNGAIDYAGIDRIAKTVRVTAVKTEGPASYTVQRTTAQAWETENQDVAATTSIFRAGTDGLRTWTTLRGLTTATVTSYNVGVATP